MLLEAVHERRLHYGSEYGLPNTLVYLIKNDDVPKN